MQKGLYVVIGLGATGLSCIRFLIKNNFQVQAMDTRDNPPLLSEIKTQFPDVNISLGKLDQAMLDSADVIVLSPGIALQTPEINAQIKKGKAVIGDIELFARFVRQRVIAITGTNAKSTVTTLVAEMATAAKLKVQVGGNLGVPALDLLDNDGCDLYVLELSSFQLETTSSLQPAVACILNISPDHLDRYDSYELYQQAKQRVYQNSFVCVYNHDDQLTYPPNIANSEYFSFTLQHPGKKQFGLINDGKQIYLGFENSPLMPINELPISGRHYQANALAAMAIVYGYGLPIDVMLKVLGEFKGLPHRCQFVREINQVKWINDSKGTNVGATVAAIEGLGASIEGKLILIAGGLGKNADFSLLNTPLKKHVRHIILFGQAAKQIAIAIGDSTNVMYADSLVDAVNKAKHAARAQDYVLLSPACASYDMFKNFEHRGNVFMELVNAL